VIFNIEYFKFIKKISVNNSWIYAYRINTKSATRSNTTLKKLQDYYYARERVINFYEEKWFRRAVKMGHVQLYMILIIQYWWFRNQRITDVIKYLFVITFSSIPLKEKYNFFKECVKWVAKLIKNKCNFY
jgi:hypothetical protein